MLRSLGVAELRHLWLCLRSNGDGRPPRASMLSEKGTPQSRHAAAIYVPCSALIAKNYRSAFALQRRVNGQRNENKTLSYRCIF